MNESGLYLFELILMRMTGFVAFNPLYGRSSFPALAKAGLTLVLSVFVFGITDAAPAPPGSVLTLALPLLLELGIGLVLGFLMRFVFAVVQVGGEVIDTQMGITMAQIYDASSQASMTVTGSLLNALLALDFFAENGHYTLMRILLTSYSTSGASDTIFIKPLSLSSLATGPKIRVPTGFLSSLSLIITAAFWSNFT